MAVFASGPSRQLGTAPALTVEVHDRLDGVDTAAWDRLVERAGAPLFYRSAYLRAYERHPLLAVETVAYLLAGDAGTGEAVAVAPLYLQRPCDPLGQLRRGHPLDGGEPGLLSHAWHCYDTRLPATRLDAEVVGEVLAAVAALAGRLGARWHGFVNVERGGELHAALLDAGLDPVPIEQRFTLELPALGGTDGYLASLRPSVRHDLRRNRRRAERAGAWTQVVAPAATDLGEVRALCQRTAARHAGGAGFYPEGRLERFVAGLDGSAVVVEVRERDRLVAAGVCLREPSRFHTWTCGVDYQVSGGYSPYGLLFDASVAAAFSSGAARLEGGRGNAPFKLRHGLRPRPLDAFLRPV